MKKSILFLACIATTLLACKKDKHAQLISDTFPIKYQETIKIIDASNKQVMVVTFNKVLRDDRCPDNAMCLEAGPFVASILLNNTTEMQLSTDSPDSNFYQGFEVVLIDVDPAPLTTHIPPEDYTLKMLVR